MKSADVLDAIGISGTCVMVGAVVKFMYDRPPEADVNTFMVSTTLERQDLTVAAVAAAAAIAGTVGHSIRQRLISRGLNR
jgi:predicted TPR repeat methyltransferase